MDSQPVSCYQIGELFQVDGKLLQQQYKNHISDYPTWDQREHATDWMLFAENAGTHLSIDETALSNGELYTIVSNKAAKGRKGALVAMIKGTQTKQIVNVLNQIPELVRKKVEEVTLDMAPNMISAIRQSFANAKLVIDRFHVQKLAFDAVQDIRIDFRWAEIDKENSQYKLARDQGTIFIPEEFSNGDTAKQLLIRSRYLLFQHNTKWTPTQKARADLLFLKYPEIGQAYDLAITLSDIFTKYTSKEIAFKKLALWYNDVESSGLEAFRTVSRSIQTHYLNILNYFNGRSTNASAESFNAKIKAFRASSRGVRDVNFFLFRLAKIYA